MATNRRLDELIRLAAPLWAGEAEIVRTYWNSPVRTRETDLLWLARQSFKEFWGSGVGKFDRGGVFLGCLKNLVAQAPHIDVSLDRHEVLDVLEGIKSEFSHYCAFADIYDALRPAGAPRLNPQMLESWPEEDALTQLRYRHQDEHGAIGMRACKFTEGGYCALFREGRALKGKGGIEDKIADACAFIYEDEIGHMLAGIADLGNETLSDAEWTLLGELVVAQMRQRLEMRNAQFSRPLSPARIAAIHRGEIEPVRFDYARAGLAA
ncbi:MAG TPA: hypothetical protein VFA22_11110 [Stellaceae bacterium]|nr:hypothetical protein [Stellaceae bacterium]